MFFSNRYKLQRVQKLQKLFLINILFSFDSFFPPLLSFPKREGESFFVTYLGGRRGKICFKICRELKENLE